MTGRGVIYIGYKCNLRCKFCYYEHEDAKKWQPIEDAKKAAHLYRNHYGLCAVDITGGEPTIYPNIHELLEYCNKIGLSPTCITNAQVLEKKEVVARFKESKVNDFLISIHGFGENYDKITQAKNGFDRLTKAIDNLNSAGITFRSNTTITTSSYKDLKKIAEFVVANNGKVINYISYNPHYDWANITNQDFQVKHSEVRPYLEDALDYCDAHAVEANVRYFPFCMMPRHKEKCYNFAQIPYDPGEWDFRGWYSTKLYNPADKIPDEFYNDKNRDAAYYLAARKQTNAIYARSPKCEQCALKNICDGLTHQYFNRYGDEEVIIQQGKKINNPTHFLSRSKTLSTWRKTDL